MKSKEFPKGVDGFILKDESCEYEEKCRRSGVQCRRDSMTKFHCGYCKSFRMIDIMRREESASLENDQRLAIDGNAVEEEV